MEHLNHWFVSPRQWSGRFRETESFHRTLLKASRACGWPAVKLHSHMVCLQSWVAAMFTETTLSSWQEETLLGNRKQKLFFWFTKPGSGRWYKSGFLCSGFKQQPAGGVALERFCSAVQCTVRPFWRAHTVLIQDWKIASCANIGGPTTWRAVVS